MRAGCDVDSSMADCHQGAFASAPLITPRRGCADLAFVCQRGDQGPQRWQCPARHSNVTRACTKALDRADGKNTVRRKDNAFDASRNLCLDRRDIELSQGGSKLRGVRVQRESTLGTIGVEDEGGDGEDSEEPVHVSVVIQPVGDDFRVMGRVATNVIRRCDLCCKSFSESVDGESFELWLDSGDGLGIDREAEAVEEFLGPRARVDLAPHVHDAVILGLPSKAVCGAECVGMEGVRSSGMLSEAGQLLPLDDETEVGGKNFVADVEDEWAGASAPTMDALLALKKKLENK